MESNCGVIGFSTLVSPCLKCPEQQATRVGAKSGNQIHRTELFNARVSRSIWSPAFTPASKLVLSNYYTPSDEQHDRKLTFITLSMVGIGGVLWYLEL